MEHTETTPEADDRARIEWQKKQIMMNIKELQRDLVKASFKQVSAPQAYNEILNAINDQREKLKKLNESHSLRKAS